MTDRTVDDRFRLVSIIGSGGMATVHRATDLSDNNRSVAIKIFEGAQSTGAQEGADRRLMRFRKEASLLESMGDSPYVARHIADGCSADGEHYIAMELVVGKTLRRLIERSDGGLEAPLFLTIADQIVSGLLSIHSHRILHRDLCPDNIMLLPPESSRIFVKFLDFGLGRFMQGETERVTGGGTVFGKPSYLSPEQSRGEPQSADSDVYSLGVVLYEMLTGSLPIPINSFAELPSVRREAPTPLSNHSASRQIPAALRALIMGCLEKQREDRPTLNAMRECLQELLRRQEGGLDLVEEFANWELSQVSVAEGERLPQFLEPNVEFGKFKAQAPRRIEDDHELWLCEDMDSCLQYEALVFPRSRVSSDQILNTARRAMEIDHENLLSIHDVLANRSLCFVVSALTDTQPLTESLDTGEAMGAARILQISEGILRGLQALHRSKFKLSHGSLSPQNILLDEFDHVWLAHPGFVRGDGCLDPFAEAPGPYAFMAPEVALGEDMTRHADVFSFGCILWNLLTGVPPASGSPLKALYSHALGQHVCLNEETLTEQSRRLLELANHCLHRDRTKRPKNVNSVLDALNAVFES